MKAISKVLVVGLLGLVAFVDTASACGNRCQVTPRNVQFAPQLNTIPQPISNPVPNPPAPGNGLTQNDSVINDLPADAKRAIKAAAAKVKANVQVRSVTANRSY